MDELQIIKNDLDEIKSNIVNIDAVGTSALLRYINDLTELHNLNLEAVEKYGNQTEMDINEKRDILNFSDELYEDIRNTLVEVTRANELRYAIQREKFSELRQARRDKRNNEQLLDLLREDLERTRRLISGIKDEYSRSEIERLIESKESEIERLETLDEYLDNKMAKLEADIDILRLGGVYNEIEEVKEEEPLVIPDEPKRPDISNDPDISRNPKKPEETDILDGPDISSDPDISRNPKKPEEADILDGPDIPDGPVAPGMPEGPATPDGPDIPDGPVAPGIPEGPEVPVVPEEPISKPVVKYKKPKLTWKTVLSVAAGVGLGSFVFFTTGPLGVSVMSIAGGIANKFINSKRAKAAAMNMIGGPVKIEAVEEPKRGIKGAINRFKNYLKSEEGLRDMSWLVNSAIISGNAWNIGTAIQKAISANNVVPQPTPDPQPIAQSTPAPQPVAQSTPAPQPVADVPTTPNYGDIRIGDTAAPTHGFRDVYNATNNTNVTPLNSTYINDDVSRVMEFAHVNDAGAVVRSGTDFTGSIADYAAQHGIPVEKVIVEGGRYGIDPHYWSNMENVMEAISR